MKDTPVTEKLPTRTKVLYGVADGCIAMLTASVSSLDWCRPSPSS
jgi:hypothetical protein